MEAAHRRRTAGGFLYTTLHASFGLAACACSVQCARNGPEVRTPREEAGSQDLPPWLLKASLHRARAGYHGLPVRAREPHLRGPRSPWGAGVEHAVHRRQTDMTPRNT